MRRNLLLLFGIFLSALFLRVYGITFGLPYEYHSDEPFLVRHALKFGTGDLNPYWFVYPTLQMYLLFGLYGFYFVIGLLTGQFSSRADFAAQYFIDPTWFYLIGRSASALLGTLTVILVYMIGRRLYNERVGLVAALFMALADLPVRQAHFLMSDTVMVFLLAASFYFCIRIWQEGRTRDYVAAGLLAGLAASSKYPGIIVVVALITAHLLRLHPGRSTLAVPLFDRALLFGLALVVVGFIAGTPYAVLDFRLFMTFIGGHYHQAQVGWLGTTTSNGVYWMVLSHFLRDGMGWPLFMISLCGAIYCLITSKKSGFLLFSFPVVFYLVMGRSNLSSPHYWIPIVPMLVVAAGKLLVDIVKYLPTAWNCQVLSLTVVAIALAAPTGISSLHYSYLLTQPDTRTLAKEWFEANVPAGTGIAMEKGGAPPISQNRASIYDEYMAELQQPFRASESYDVTGRESVTTKSQYYELLLSMPVSEPSYYVTRAWSLADRSLTYYTQSGFKYIIVAGPRRQLYMRDRERYPEAAAFYEELEARYPLVRVFQPNPVNRPGPDIFIYRID